MKKYLIVLLVFTLFSLKSFSADNDGNHQIIGATTVVAGMDYNYYVTPDDGVTYNWTVVGGTIIDGQGTSSVDVSWDLSTGVQGQLQCDVNHGEDLVVVWPTGA